MISCLEFFKSELRLSSFCFNYSRSRDFVSSQWNWFKPTAFIVYRLLMVIIIFMWLIIDTSNNNGRSNDRSYFWSTFATNWGLQALVVCYLLYAIATIYYNRDEKCADDVKYYQVLWFFQTISINSVVVICVIFWVFLSRQKPETLGGVTREVRWKHSLPGIMVILDSFLSSHPFRLLHFVYPVLFGLVYVAFTAIFYYAQLVGPFGIGAVYKDFDWSRPEKTSLHIFEGILCSILVQVGLVGVYLIRGWISYQLGGKAIPIEMYYSEEQSPINDRHPILKNNRSGHSQTSYE